MKFEQIIRYNFVLLSSTKAVIFDFESFFLKIVHEFESAKKLTRNLNGN